MATTLPDALIAHNPATGAELGRVAMTSPECVPDVVEQAREAQRRWATTTWAERREVLRRFWSILARDAETWAERIRDEVGKPIDEAIVEVVAALDAVRWTVRRGGKALRDVPLGRGGQRLLLIPPARLAWRPLGVVGLIGTWNYPLLLNAPTVAQALAAGNGVVWKPSELASLSGLHLQRAFEESGFPSGLAAAVQGGPEVGQALVGSNIDKGHFTGGITGGRRVLAALAERGIPAVAELSGFDPAIVLPDAPLDSTTRALAWSSFIGAGQTCVAVKRLYTVGDPRPWADRLALLASQLRVGDPASNAIDMGPLISEAARERFDGFIQRANDAGADVLAGGETLHGPGWFYRPTVLLAQDERPETALAGCFGPVVLVRGVADEEAAIAAANASDFGLSASVWGRDRRRARSIAERLEAGMVSVNDAVAPIAHAAAPFGGTKASGFGRVRGVAGLHEFVQSQVVYLRAPGGLRPQLFPYGGKMTRLMAAYRRLFHRSE